MKKVISIYHPSINHKIEELTKINSGHIFFSTFLFFDLIEEKIGSGSFYETIKLNDLFEYSFSLSYSNNQFVFKAGNTIINSKPNIFYNVKSDDLFKNSDLRLFLHEIEQLLIEISDKPCILETTSFISPSKKVTSIVLSSTESRYNNPASLFIDLGSNYIDNIEKNLIVSKDTYRFKFSTVEYKKYFSENPNNKLIESFRPVVKKQINMLSQKRLFDNFDLEIQSLAMLTLHAIDDLKNQDFLSIIVKDALVVIDERYKKFKEVIPALQLLTPKGIFQEKTRYWFDKDRIFAVPTNNQGIDKSRAVEIEFKVMNKELALDFIECFHYIHNRHDFDSAFGFYIKGEVYPYAVSLVEKISPRLYKEEFLKQIGINPERVLDELRLYSLPWCPMTTSSVLSYKVRDFIRSNLPNITHTITAVNRNIFSGTYIQQAGYIPLAFKPAKFGFNEFCYSEKLIPYYNGSDPRLPQHSIHPLLPTVEYYRPIRKNNYIETNGEVFDISYEQYLQE
ncbi:MAG: hypothetical protein WDZ94_01855 [Patescibacteria group bacterium]